MSGRRSPRLVDRRAALAVAAHPRLWGAALTLILRMAPRGWWRRWPPLPSPSPAYAAFRVHTVLGGSTPPDERAGTAQGYGASRHRGDRPLAAGEVVAFLEWSRRMRILTTRGDAPR